MLPEENDVIPRPWDWSRQGKGTCPNRDARLLVCRREEKKMMHCYCSHHANHGFGSSRVTEVLNLTLTFIF